MAAFLKEYWWIILVILIGLFTSGIKELNKLSFESYLKKKRSPKEQEIQEKNKKQTKK